MDKNNADIKADIILANLTADILINISQAVADKHIAEGGYLICSGIIKGKSKQVKECFEPKGFIIEKKFGRGRLVGFIDEEIKWIIRGFLLLNP